MVSQTQLRQRTSISQVPKTSTKPQERTITQPVPPTTNIDTEEYQDQLREYESKKKVYDAYEATVAEYGGGYVSSKILMKYDLNKRERAQVVNLIEGDAKSIDLQIREQWKR